MKCVFNTAQGILSSVALNYESVHDTSLEFTGAIVTVKILMNFREGMN